MGRVVVLGAGRIGRRIAGLLAGRAGVVMVEHDAAKLDAARAAGHDTVQFPPGGGREVLRRTLAGARALIAVEQVLPGADLAALCIEAGCHYLDLTETDRNAAEIARAADAAPRGVRFAPGCGLAPGWVTALLAQEIADAPPAAEITAFVGVLPLRPVNRLGYANIWGVPGLVQEYTRPVVDLAGGALRQSAPLGGAERLTLGGVDYEAFTTAGSIDALARRSEGRVQGLSFKTLRYPGHRDYMLFLLDDLGLRQQTQRLTSLLQTALPMTEADRVVIALRTVPGPGVRPRWRVRQHEAAALPDGTCQSAMATLAAAHAVAVLDHLTGPAPLLGPVLMPGDIGLDALRASPCFALLDGAATADGPAACVPA